MVYTIKDYIAKVSVEGGYILSSSNTVHPGVKPENFITMVTATRKYGKYPLELEVM